MSGTDSETGEFVSYTNYPTGVPAVFDLETGEPDTTDFTTIKLRKTRFNVPKNLLNQEPALKCCIDPNETFTLSKKEQVMTLQEVNVSVNFSRLHTETTSNFFSSSVKKVFVFHIDVDIQLKTKRCVNKKFFLSQI